MINPNRRNDRIFISYRREDNAGVTGRIYDRLVQEFGGQAIFKDIDSIPLGVNFKRHIDSIVKECDVALVIIGDKWAGETGQPSNRRIDDPNDIVRIEIESALDRNIRVIPLLIQGVSIPSEGSLPGSLKGLADRHGITIGNDPHFHPDMERLIRDLQIYFDSLTGTKPTPDANRIEASDTRKFNAPGNPHARTTETPDSAEGKSATAVGSKGIRRPSLSWTGILGYVLALAIGIVFLAYQYARKPNQGSLGVPAQLVNQETLKAALLNAKHSIRATGFLVQAVDADLVNQKLGADPNFNAEILMVDPLRLDVVCARQNDETNALTYGKILFKLRIFHKNFKNLLGNRVRVGLTGSYPTMNVIMIDDDLYVYFYSYQRSGTDSPILKFANYTSDEKAKFFVDHYNKLRAAAKNLISDADFEGYERADLNYRCPTPTLN
jgi:hypothetical protein